MITLIRMTWWTIQLRFWQWEVRRLDEQWIEVVKLRHEVTRPDLVDDCRTMLSDCREMIEIAQAHCTELTQKIEAT
jgi:hypothetical protein